MLLCVAVITVAILSQFRPANEHSDWFAASAYLVLLPLRILCNKCKHKQKEMFLSSAYVERFSSVHKVLMLVLMLMSRWFSLVYKVLILLRVLPSLVKTAAFRY